MTETNDGRSRSSSRSAVHSCASPSGVLGGKNSNDHVGRSEARSSDGFGGFGPAGMTKRFGTEVREKPGDKSTSANQSPVRYSTHLCSGSELLEPTQQPNLGEGFAPIGAESAAAADVMLDSDDSVDWLLPAVIAGSESPAVDTRELAQRLVTRSGNIREGDMVLIDSRRPHND